MIAAAIVNTLSAVLVAFWIPYWICRAVAFGWHRHPDRVMAAGGCVLLMAAAVAMTARGTPLAWSLPFGRLFRWVWRWLTDAALQETAEKTRAECRHSARTSEDVCNRTGEILRLGGDKDAR